MAAHSALNYLRSVLRIAAREWKQREAPAPTGEERLVAERWGLVVEPRRVADYLRATDGAGIARFHGDDGLVPPVFPAVWETGLAVELLCHPRAPSVRRGIVHLESELLQVRPLRTRDTVRCRLELERAERDPRGVRLHLHTRTWNGGGQLLTENRTVLLARSGAHASGHPRGPRPAEPDFPYPADEVARWRLRAGHGRRYARASGDYNPIHLSRLTALPFGFRRPILHGFCTQAMVAHALIRHRFGGDPARLRRLRIRFRRPLLLPATTRLEVATGENGAGAFRVSGEGDAVYADGQFGGV